MKKIEDAMNFKIYDYKTGAVAEDSALIYHGYMSEGDKAQLTKILLDIGNMNALVLSADEILEGYSSLDEAIQGLPDKYKKIRAAFEIKA
jgi:hypothetical protein